MKNQAIKIISEATIRRLPGYWRYLRSLRGGGRQVVSCTRISQALNVTAIQVRKDLAASGIIGRPKTGYLVEDLINHIERFLGWQNTREAFLVGAGHLGQALLGYEGFEEHGMRIVAAFDCDSERIGSVCHGREILPVEKLSELAHRMHTQIGIITTPARAAQAIADQMVAGGIRAIWNFAPVRLQVPADVVIEPVELSASLAVLSSKLERTLTAGQQ